MTPETRAALALVDAGLPAAQVDRVLRMVDVGDTDTPEEVTAKVASLAEDVPGLFADVKPAGQPRPRVIDGGKARERSGQSFEDLGREALAAAGIKHPSQSAPERGRQPWAGRNGGGHAV